MCTQIRDNKKFTLDRQNVELYKKDLALFEKLVSALSNLPITAKTLLDSKIGKGINSIVKDGIFKDELVNKQALDLVNCWKDQVEKHRHNKNKNNRAN